MHRLLMKFKKPIILAFLVAILSAISLFRSSQSKASFTLFTDTLSTSRLSVAARVLTISGNLVSINPTASGVSPFYYSTSSANLRVGDVVTINSVSHTINSIEATSSTQFTTVASAPAGSPADAIYYRSKPVHKITFNTSTSVPNGFFRVLIPASATSANVNDTFPDPDGFDFNAMVGTNASESATANFTWATLVSADATVSGGTNCSAGYHCFEFHYSGTGPSGSTITLWIGNNTNSLIAPAPSSTHGLGIADTYPIIVQQFPNAANPSTAVPIDQTKGRIGLIESVRVSATVDPSISFQITGVASGITTCGAATTIDTQTALNAPLSVPFGVLSLNTFARAAHNLVVSTNATNGYIVTASESGAMSLNGAGVTTIADTSCDSTCAYNGAGAAWTSAGNSGFGYSMETVSGSGLTVAPISTNFRAFPNPILLQAPVTIMSSTGVSNTHTAHVCYKIAVSSNQAAGDYENMITYTATASF